LGLEPKDLDYLVLGASEEEFLQEHPGAKKIGHSPYQVYLYQGAQYTLGDSQDIHTELQKKDLGINSLAQDSQGRLLGSAQARQDLEQKILRPVRLQNFLQDPVRVFRAARLSAKLPEFKVHAELLQAMQEVCRLGLLARAAAERVGQELNLACSTPKPGNFLRLLAETGNLQPWFLELEQARRIPAGPGRAGQYLLQYLTGLMDAAADSSPQLVWLAMAHDLGKTRTDPAYWPRHYLHDYLGPKVIRNLGARLKLPTRQVQTAELTAAWHLAGCGYFRLKPGRKVDMLLSLHQKGHLEGFSSFLQLLQGSKLQGNATRELQKILQVRLPLEYRSLGPVSGKILKDLRIKALQDRDT
jgi:tRNA nucleotidyltransferase (CCA-adding enzyme)